MALFKIREAILTSPAKRDRIIVTALILSCLLNLGIWAALLLAFWQSSEYIVFHYNIYFGINSLTPWYFVAVIPATALLFSAVDFLLSFYLYLCYRLLSYFSAATALTVNLLLAVASGLLIYVNW